MERFCFDFPHEVFPFHHGSGMKEGFGKFSGWLPTGIFKRLGHHDKVYNPLSPCFPLHKPNLCFLPFEKPLDGGATVSRVDKCIEDQVSFFHSTYHDTYVPEAILEKLCMEAATDEETYCSSRNSLGFRSCDYHGTLGAVYYPSGADLHQITIGLLINNALINMQAHMVDAEEKNFSQYSRTHATCCVQDVERYQTPSAVREIFVTSSQGKDILGIRCQYHCIVFSDSISNKVDNYIQHCENSTSQGEVMGDIDFSHLQSFEHRGVVKCTKHTSAFCINPQSVGEAVLITDDGTLNLWTLDTGIITPYTSLGGHTHWWECFYGTDPSQLTIADPSSVYLLDLRNPTQRSLPLHLSNCHSVRALSPHPLHPYHNLISTAESLLLLDVRRPLQPIQSYWKTEAKLSEYFLSTGGCFVADNSTITYAYCQLLAVNFDDYGTRQSPFVPSGFLEVTATDALDTLILLPSHQQQLLVQYSGGYVRWDGKSGRPDVPAPHLTMNPHSLPHYSSLLTGEPSNAASHRLTSPLIGSCIVQCGEPQMGIIELSQLGDLFYHQWNYVDQTEHSTSTDLPLVDKSLWRLWQQEATLQEKQCLPYQEIPLMSSQLVDLAPISKYILDSSDNMKCLLCHAYQTAIGNISTDEVVTPNTCTFCGCKLSTAKHHDGISISSDSAQHLLESFDLSSLPADEYSLVHGLWYSWGQDEQQPPVLNEEQSVTLPKQQELSSLSSSLRHKRTRSFGTKQIGF